MVQWWLIGSTTWRCSKSLDSGRFIAGEALLSHVEGHRHVRLQEEHSKGLAYPRHKEISKITFGIPMN